MSFTALAVSNVYIVEWTSVEYSYSQCQPDCATDKCISARLRERFLFRFLEFLLSPADWFFVFFFLHDNGFGPFTRFRLCPSSLRIPKVDSFKQLNAVCSCAAGSILV